MDSAVPKNDQVIATSGSVNIDHNYSSDEYTAAGILPYCILGGDILFLLGKEKFYQYVQKPNNPNAPKTKLLGLLWSDFGGRRETADEGAPEKTAAREFAEETYGMFEGIGMSAQNVQKSSSTMLDILNAKEKYGKEVFKIENGQYVMFVAPVPFVEDLMLNLAREQQEQNSEINQKPPFCGNEGRKEEEPWATGMGATPEKLDFAWVPALNVVKMLEKNQKKSRRKVCLELGDCRVFHMFHKFVFTLYNSNFVEIVEILQKSANSLKVENGRSGEELIRPCSRVGYKRQRLGILGVAPEIHKKIVADIKSRKQWEMICKREKRKKKRKKKMSSSDPQQEASRLEGQIPPLLCSKQQTTLSSNLILNSDCIDTTLVHVQQRK